MSPSDCLISIIVPSYNQPAFVGQCLESIFAQAEATFEVILIDGGSAAATLEQIAPYRTRLAHYVSEKDRGQSHAINKGLAVARGQIVTWLNTDDFYLPGALAALTAAYRRNPHAPFYLGMGFRTNEDDTRRIPFYPEHFAYSREALVWGLNFVLQPATAINRHALQVAGAKIDESLHFAMDSDLWLTLSRQGEPEMVGQAIACSREYASTKTSGGGWNRVFEIQRVTQKHAGAPLTPGVLAEICRQLHECAGDPQVAQHFPPQLQSAIVALWGQAAAGLRMVSNRDDGLPVKS